MYHFIVNPHSRSGLGKETWNVIEHELITRGIDYQVYETKYQRHATKITETITQQPGPHTIIVLGGDGTMNEVVNGIYNLTAVTLGYIPIGSSNDFARGFQLPKDPLIALDYLLNPVSLKQMDVGYLKYGAQKKRRFVVSCGIGFDAAVCHQIVISRLKKLFNRIKLGKLAYTFVALQQLIKATPADMMITVDGTTKRYENVLFAAVMNQKYEGGGFNFCPQADPCDGHQDLIIAHGMSKLKVLGLLPLAYKGWHAKARGITIMTGTRFEIRSDKALPIHSDGEPVFLHKHLVYGMESGKIQVLDSK